MSLLIRKPTSIEQRIGRISKSIEGNYPAVPGRLIKRNAPYYTHSTTTN
jgi:hypothetical protein